MTAIGMRGSRRARAAVTRGRVLSLRTRGTVRSVLIGTAVALVLWEVAARILAATTAQGDRVLPSLTKVATDGFLGLGHYYKGGLGVSVATAGGDGSALASTLALVENAGVTLMRVGVGLVLAIALGIVLGLLVAAVRPVRLSVSGVSEVLRMLPALAMAPLFTIWFGATSLASVVFVVFSVAFIVLLATSNAVANLRPEVTEYPRTLGVRGVRLWTRVVLPAILPEIRGPLVFGGIVAWASVLASEMYGLQEGLGYMLNDTLRFSIIERMVVVAVVFSALALLTMKLLGALVDAVTRWRP
ncbi:ABC transporter permease [Schumannella sp. 10F1B-5-1]|uniref:ABC transporter permease n=1 Tax=Schumannella sp. 10F1B-5-1 TaxID=2590780 RepID=UPI001130FB4F|nr:ABC transporter permease subunit [Schumannella sp. 10F1B-5-1]TPW78273.1 ABC transporter permease subunit [Schumannella sp. 10F1B-5-1]